MRYQGRYVKMVCPAACCRSSPMSPSSRGLGRGPFKAETRVRIPVGTPSPFGRWLPPPVFRHIPSRGCSTGMSTNPGGTELVVVLPHNASRPESRWGRIPSLSFTLHGSLFSVPVQIRSRALRGRVFGSARLWRSFDSCLQQHDDHDPLRDALDRRGDQSRQSHPAAQRASGHGEGGDSQLR
jgi:hypothetical protein